MRKYIDYHLFGFKLSTNFNNYNDDKLTEIAIKVKNKNPTKALQKFRNTGTDEPCGVKDWYIGINPNDNINTAIIKCQKQNIWWDKKLSEICINILKVTIAVLLVILLIVFSKNTVIDTVCFLLSLSTLISKAIMEYITISNYRKVSISIEALLKVCPDTINKKYLMELQDMIDQRRSIPFVVPNLLHKITTKKFHTTMNAIYRLK